MFLFLFLYFTDSGSIRTFSPWRFSNDIRFSPSWDMNGLYADIIAAGLKFFSLLWPREASWSTDTWLINRVLSLHAVPLLSLPSFPRHTHTHAAKTKVTSSSRHGRHGCRRWHHVRFSRSRVNSLSRESLNRGKLKNTNTVITTESTV